MELSSAEFYENSQKYFTRTGVPPVSRSRRRAAGVKIAGAGLTKRYFCSCVLYLDGMGKQKIPKASYISKSQKYFTRTAVVFTSVLAYVPEMQNIPDQLSIL